MKTRLLPEAEHDLEIGAEFYDLTDETIDIYAVLDCRQDPATIRRRRLEPPRTKQ